MKVLNFGSLNYDYVYAVHHIVEPGETQSSMKMNTFCGGKGFNQSMALARAGVPVYHAGMVGEDGQLFREMADKTHIDMKYLKTVPGKSGHAIIQVDQKAQNAILLYGGANRAITRDYADEVLSHFEKGDLILLQNEISEMNYIISQAAQRGMIVILNPSPYDKQMEACDLTKVDYFLINEVEGSQITGEKEAEKILSKMKEQFPDSHIVLTLGDKGAYLQDSTGCYYQPAYKVRTVDTTAAGDTFTGYFIYGLLHNLAPEEILELCARASAIAVSRAGAAISIPTLEEVKGTNPE